MRINGFSVKKKSRLNINKILGYSVAVFFGYLLITSLPDIKRYIKMEMM